MKKQKNDKKVVEGKDPNVPAVVIPKEVFEKLTWLPFGSKNQGLYSRLHRKETFRFLVDGKPYVADCGDIYRVIFKEDKEEIDRRRSLQRRHKVRPPHEVRKLPLNRNDPCHCGSNKKYKKCCMREDEKTL